MTSESRKIVEFGPSLGSYRDRDIPAYFVTAAGTRHEFDRIAVVHPEGGVELSQMTPNESVIAPGLIYRDAPGTASEY